MYSPLNLKYGPHACCRPAWNSLRKPGVSGEPVQANPCETVMIALTTGLVQPVPESMRFSLNGVSMVRAYEIRSTVFVLLMLYAIPGRGCTALATACRPL